MLGIPILALAGRALSAEAPAWGHILGTSLPTLTANSIGLAAIVGVGVFLLGTATAWVTATTDFFGRRAFEWLLLLPLAMPSYVMGYAYTDFLQYAGPLQGYVRELFGWTTRADYWFPDFRSLGGAALVLSFALYPYVYLLGRIAFIEQSAHLAEAARTFGYSPTSLFMNVSLPLARPALIAGTALALMETLADYGTVAYFGVPTFTTGIFNAWFSQSDAVSAARLSLVLLGCIAVMVAVERIARRKQRFSVERGGTAARVSLTGLPALIAWLTCFLPILVGFAIPAALLLRLMRGAASEDVLGWHRFVELALNSVTLSVATAAFVLLIGLLLAYAIRAQAGVLVRAAHRLVSLGYAVPGTVVAVAVLIPLIALDHQLAAVLSQFTGRPWGLLLSGTIVGLVYAYLIRFSAIGVQTIDAGFAKIDVNLDDAARSLGAATPELVRKVHAPLLRGSLLTAALLVFVDVMKELPATLVMRPFNFDTLAVHTYVLAKDERLSEASFAAIAIVLVGLIPVIVASRAITQESRRS